MKNLLYENFFQKGFDEKQVRDSLRLFVIDVASQGEELVQSYSWHSVMNFIATCAGDFDVWRHEGKYTRNIQKVIAILMEELGQYAKNRNAIDKTRFSRLPYGKQRAEHYSSIFQKVFFSGSPSVISGLPAVESFNVTIEFDQIPNLDIGFVDNIFGDLVYRFAFATPQYLENFLDDISKKFKDANVSDQIAIVKKIALLGENCITAGYDSALDLTQKFVDFLYKLSELTEIPMTGIAAYASAEQLKASFSFNETGEIGDLDFQNLCDKTRKSIKKRYIDAQKYKFPEHAHGRGEEIRVISSDYVAIYGELGRPIELAPRKVGARFADTQEIFSLPSNIPFGSQNDFKDNRYLYEQMQSPLQCGMIESIFDIDLSKFSLRSQIQLMMFISSRSIEQYDELLELKAQGKIPNSFYQALFAINAKKEIGDALLLCAKNHESEVVDSICQKYNKIINAIDQVEDKVQKFFSDKQHKIIDARLVSQEFSKRAADVLLRAALNPENSTQFFEGLTNDILLFTSIFKSAIKSGSEFKLEDIAGLDLAAFSGEELPDEIRKSLKEITAANWLVRGEVGKKVVEGFNTIVDQSDDERVWHILRRGSEVISFVRFDGIQKTGDDRAHEYAGSFNVHPAYRGSAIGEAMMNEVLIEESKRAMLHATMDPRIEVGTRYVEDIGFLVTGVAENYLDTPESFFEITADHDALQNFESRGWTREQVFEFARAHSRESIIAQAQRGDIIVASVTRNAGAEPQFIADAAQVLRAGYIGTRYISEGPDSKMRYMIFEKAQ